MRLIYRARPPTPPLRPRVVTLAGVAELADALVLGTSSSECGFESLRPHRLRRRHRVAVGRGWRLELSDTC